MFNYRPAFTTIKIITCLDGHEYSVECGQVRLLMKWCAREYLFWLNYLWFWFTALIVFDTWPHAEKSLIKWAECKEIGTRRVWFFRVDFNEHFTMNSTILHSIAYSTCILKSVFFARLHVTKSLGRNWWNLQIPTLIGAHFSASIKKPHVCHFCFEAIFSLAAAFDRMPFSHSVFWRVHFIHLPLWHGHYKMLIIEAISIGSHSFRFSSSRKLCSGWG